MDAFLFNLSGRGFNAALLNGSAASQSGLAIQTSGAVWQVAKLNAELRLLGGGQESLRKFCEKNAPWIKSNTVRMKPVRILLIGVAGALDPALKLGEVIIQRSKTSPTEMQDTSPLLLSQTPVENRAGADALFQMTKKKAVVMESFCSDPHLKIDSEIIEIRGISDHCEGVSLAEIRLRLPKVMESVVNATLVELNLNI